ncbi:GtrA family protein [Solihabitans fulvus]|nr:GtrA family protein [Solihabitans fulvus]
MPFSALPRAILGSRPARFALTGFTAMAVSYGSLFTLVTLLHVNTALAYLVQAALAIEVNYLLNLRFTWADRQGGLWRTWWRFHASRLALVPVNQALFTVLVWAEVNYLVANTVCIVGSTVANYVLGDRFVFAGRRTARTEPTTTEPTVAEPTTTGPTTAEPTTPAPPACGDRRRRWQGDRPAVSVVVPVKHSAPVIRPLVVSLLEQDYDGRIEVVLVGDLGDSTWSALDGHLGRDPVTAYEAEVHAPLRDANAKRNIGLDRATGEVLVLTDSDMRLPLNWVSTAVSMLAAGHHAVAGPMRSVSTAFWGRYIDQNMWGSKTPRMDRGYLLTERNFGRGNNMPPVTANFACTRSMYEHVGGPPTDFSYSYEDYPWFLAIVNAGYDIRCAPELAAWHRHRSTLRSLIKEYRESGWGCADYIATHPTCRLARRRLAQLLALLGVASVGAVAAAAAPLTVLATAGALAAATCVASAVRGRALDAAAFPLCTTTLGLAFALGMLVRFARRGWRAPVAVVTGTIQRLHVAGPVSEAQFPAVTTQSS